MGGFGHMMGAGANARNPSQNYRPMVDPSGGDMALDTDNDESFAESRFG